MAGHASMAARNLAAVMGARGTTSPLTAYWPKAEKKPRTTPGPSTPWLKMSSQAPAKMSSTSWNPAATEPSALRMKHTAGLRGAFVRLYFLAREAA